MTDRLWQPSIVIDPTRVMLAPFEYVVAMVGGTRRRVGAERFRSLFPITVRMHPDVYLAVAAHPLTVDGIIPTPDGPMRVRPDASLAEKDVRIDPRKG